jgi:hypothetical protein
MSRADAIVFAATAGEAGTPGLVRCEQEATVSCYPVRADGHKMQGSDVAAAEDERATHGPDVHNPLAGCGIH